jgi:MYXO-CTERM domain-containing protein
MAIVSVKAIEGAGTLVVPRFEVIGKAGATSTLTIDAAQAWEATTEQFAMQVSATSGTFTVTSASAFPLWIVLVAVAVLVVLLLLWLLRRRRREPERSVPTAPDDKVLVVAGGKPGGGFCSACGQPLTAGAAFCGGCGHRVGT